MIFVIGSRGRLGRAICNQYAATETVLVDRAAYAHWAGGNGRSEIASFFSSRAQQGDIVFVCSGVLDPSAAGDELEAVNVRLPSNLIEVLSPLGVRVVTFGTVMEEILSTNPYVQSKRKLGLFVAEKYQQGAPVTHIRIHTLYGLGEPSPFMLLGLMAEAMRKNRPFRMTSGLQLREYHHVEDDSAAIRCLMEKSVSGVVALSHGEAVTLSALALSVFNSVGLPHLLHLGELEDPAQENFTQVFSKHEVLAGVSFRDTLTGVADYMKTLV
ncbi:NAD dependent epimerase/dehydratase family protein [compost metagenome]